MLRPAVPGKPQQAITHTVEESILDHALKPGDTAPNFQLKDAVGQYTRLEDLLENGPVVLTFYRGGWCPNCNATLQELQHFLEDIQAHGATLIALSPQDHQHTIPTKHHNNLQYEVHSDPGNAIAREFGLVFEVDEEAKELHHEFGIPLPHYNADDSWELPIPATYIISPDQTITHAFLDLDCAQRPNPQAILDQLKTLAENN